MEPVPVMTQTSPTQSPRSKKFLYIGVAFGLLIAIVIVAYSLSRTYTQRPSENVVATVGKEKIYEKDLKYELSRYSTNASDQDKKLLLNKMINDSITLQANGVTPAPNYEERLKQVDTSKQAIVEQAETITGTVLSVWFYNEWIGPLGYEGSKDLALTKISELHDQVKAKLITIEQAGEILHNDFGMRQLSLQYRTNSVLNFSADRNKKITFSPDFNTILWNLKEGEVSDIYLAKDNQPDPTAGVPRLDSDDTDVLYVDIDAVYMFGQVTKHSGNSRIVNYDNWLEQQKRNYEIKIN